jgi:hypothetical protein
VRLRRVAQARTVAGRIAGAPASATFAVGHAAGGRLVPVLVDPAGRRHTAARPGRGVAFRRSGTLVVIRVTRPANGRWLVVLTPTRLAGGGLAARVSLTVPRG